jgi:hypothetical protein
MPVSFFEPFALGVIFGFFVTSVAWILDLKHIIRQNRLVLDSLREKTDKESSQSKTP